MATQSLYRRYRPRRFSELKGQDHVVKALRDAVAQGREGQAYLFSGPRGTGKTTSARILAKVLNCQNVVDGEPCCECESCLAVERGASYDVHELDAASNNGVDAIRDLVEKASLGTPGRHKVYILDEVHMLSKAAEAALLKTLEEPPPHVVFVLATTDPQKMSDTIRSRTQHLQFHLLPADTLAEHVRWVADDAGYELSQSALDAALAQGGGSARDTLSALELIASTGGEVDQVVDLDEFLAALTERDAGRALTAMGHAVRLGRDPRTITEDLLRHLRNAFMSLMAPELVLLPSDRVDAIAASAQRLGPAAIVRAIERLGSALVDMRHAPDPRILVEVALVQLTHDEAGSDLDALLARLERLEQKVKHGIPAAPGAASATAAPVDPATGRAVLGGAARHTAHGTAPDAGASAPADPEAAPADVGVSAPPTGKAVLGGAVRRPAPVADPGDSDRTDAHPADGDATPANAPADPEAPAERSSSTAVARSVPEAWEGEVKGRLKGMARPLFAAGEFVGETGGVWRFSVPNPTHAAKCEDHREQVEAALSAAVGAPVRIEIVAGGTPAETSTPTVAPAPEPERAAETSAPLAPRESAVERAARAAASVLDDEDAPPPPIELPHDDEIDLSELTDAPPESVKTPIDRLAEAFPGSELMTDD